MVNRMKRAGLGLREHKLDNEASDAFKDCITRNGMKYELVPPGNHRRNQAKRAIQTFKAHFISILAEVDDKFPLSLWCQLLEPAELTLNLLRQSRITPNISAYAHVHGPHDYMRKPMAPLGCAIQAHVKPDERRTWDTRSESGFNLGTSMEHHRCFRVYITRTRATRISDTVHSKHQYITNPEISPESLVVAAAQQLTVALKGSIPTGNETAEALTKVSELFTKIAAHKQAAATAKAQRNVLRSNPTAIKTTHFPRVDPSSIPRVATPPRVTIPPVDCRVPNIPVTAQEDCRVGGGEAQIVTPDAGTLKIVEFMTARRTRAAPRPNYISQDEEDSVSPPQRRITRSHTGSILQEAMLSCVDENQPNYIASLDLGLLNFASTKTKTTFEITPQQLSMRRLPMAWLCEMANAVIGDNGELLEYKHLIANPKTRATWLHS
jgi:hypothetical protein